MQGEQHPTRVALREAREQVIDRLSAGFAKDELGLDEFERRVDFAFRCTTPDDLRQLIADLEPPAALGISAVQGLRNVVPESEVEIVPQATNALATSSSQPVSRIALAIFGHVERRGNFRMTKNMRASAIFGNVELDLRGVVLPPGVTHLEVKAVFGNIEIIVPPNLAVECDGMGVFYSFSAVHRIPPDHDLTQSVLRITGRAVFGNVEILTRPIGWTAPGSSYPISSAAHGSLPASPPPRLKE